MRETSVNSKNHSKSTSASKRITRRPSGLANGAVVVVKNSYTLGVYTRSGLCPLFLFLGLRNSDGSDLNASLAARGPASRGRGNGDCGYRFSARGNPRRARAAGGFGQKGGAPKGGL